MLYLIADICVEMPSFGGMPERMRAYEFPEGEPALVLKREEYHPESWKIDNTEIQNYMETGWVFYRHLIDFDGFMLHSSAVVVDGYAYLFTGPCGMGKSTHARLYLQQFGDRAEIINDDKPALRRIDGQWYVYGTPWCGKEGINVNRKAKLAGICVLHRGDTEIRRMEPQEILRFVLGQTQHKMDAPAVAKLMKLMDYLIREVPVFSLHSHAQPEDAALTYTEITKAISAKGE